MQLRIGMWFLLFKIAQNIIFTPSYWISRHFYLASGSHSDWTFFLSWTLAASLDLAVLTAPVLLVPLFIVEQRLSISESIQSSWNVSRRSLPQLFAALICVQIIGLSGPIACTVGLLLTGGIISMFIVTCGFGLILFGAVTFTFPAVAYQQLVAKSPS
jgi:membrane-anchored glycerophosphoryl diester phosphodiesterase (GDPDase)